MISIFLQYPFKFFFCFCISLASLSISGTSLLKIVNKIYEIFMFNCCFFQLFSRTNISYKAIQNNYNQKNLHRCSLFDSVLNSVPQEIYHSHENLRWFSQLINLKNISLVFNKFHFSSYNCTKYL